jgi:hypothetical protein
MRPAVGSLHGYLHSLILKWMRRQLYLYCEKFHGFTQHDLIPLAKLYFKAKHVRHKWHVWWSYQLYYPFDAWPSHTYVSPLCHACHISSLSSSSRLLYPNVTTLHQTPISKEGGKIEGVCLCSGQEEDGEYIQNFDSKTFTFFTYEIICCPSLYYERLWYHSRLVIRIDVSLLLAFLVTVSLFISQFNIPVEIRQCFMIHYRPEIALVCV